jgi:hypothetical protein
MSREKHLHGEITNGSSGIIVNLMVAATWITGAILILIHVAEGLCLLDTEPTQVPPGHVVIRVCDALRCPGLQRGLH